MNTSKITNKVMALGGMLSLALALLVPAVAAEPSGVNYGRIVSEVRTQTQAKEIKPDSMVEMVCGSCKTVKISEFKSTTPGGAPPVSWFEVGSKHECTRCGGTITVVAGKTADEMQHNCSKCGEGAAFCCAAAPEKK